MCKLILMMLLAFFNSGAVAEWVRVGKIEADKLVVYANPDTIRRTGNKVSIWNILDFKVVQRSAGSTNFSATYYLSVKARHEYDCEKHQHRILGYYWHAKNMGNGTLVLSDDIQDEWSPIHPCSTNEILLNYVCRKS